MRTLKKLKPNKRRHGDFIFTLHKDGRISIKIDGKHLCFMYTNEYKNRYWLKVLFGQ